MEFRINDGRTRVKKRIPDHWFVIRVLLRIALLSEAFQIMALVGAIQPDSLRVALFRNIGRYLGSFVSRPCKNSPRRRRRKEDLPFFIQKVYIPPRHALPLRPFSVLRIQVPLLRL